MAATVLLGVFAMVSAVSASVALAGGSVDPWMSGAHLLTFVVAGSVMLTWTYRACARVQAAGARHLSASPAMAVGSYFLPIANLFMPYAALRDIWKASIDPADWEALETPFVLKIWWLSWVVGNGVGLVVWRLEVADGQAANLRFLSGASDALLACCALSLATCVNQISSFQAVCGGDRLD